jgi:hypothetical protein
MLDSHTESVKLSLSPSFASMMCLSPSHGVLGCFMIFHPRFPSGPAQANGLGTVRHGEVRSVCLVDVKTN